MTQKKVEDKYTILDKISEDKVKKIFGEETNSFLANLLYARGLESKEDIDFFTDPKWDQAYDPFLFKDMDIAVPRILEAIYNDEKIVIYSDYDTDGIPGGAIFKDFLEKINCKNFYNHIPNRNKDGYGLNLPACEKFVEDEVDLIITIDCGITDIEEAKFLKKNGIDLIVTDHHLPGKKLPEALAVIDHKREDNTYPDTNICGCAVAFKLIQALIIKGREDQLEDFVELPEGWEKWLLDLVSISTICDMVPLVGENRIFVNYGKKVLAKTQRPGLNQIILKSRLDKTNISAYDIGFMIGPRINAASRLSDPNIALKALSLDEGSVEFAKELERLNNRRKTMTASIMKDVWKRLESRELFDVIVIGDEKWPLGIVGLIAGRIADKYKRPAFVWTRLDEKVKGSCRSGSEISIHSLMEETKDSFKGFGGHAASGGFETTFDEIHFLEEKLSSNTDKAKKIEVKEDVIDEELVLDDVNMMNYNSLKTMEPYGMANPKPLFLFKNVKIVEVKEFGKDNSHLQLTFKNSRNQNVRAMTFSFMDKLDRRFTEGEEIDLVGSFDVNYFNGMNYLRIKIEDIF